VNDRGAPRGSAEGIVSVDQTPCSARLAPQVGQGWSVPGGAAQGPLVERSPGMAARPEPALRTPVAGKQLDDLLPYTGQVHAQAHQHLGRPPFRLEVALVARRLRRRERPGGSDRAPLARQVVGGALQLALLGLERLDPGPHLAGL
jgi:hypothetical protein